jgi:type II secretory pathway pseudopilin PulG
MKVKTRSIKKGFTLVETVAATFILGSAVLVLAAGVSRSLVGIRLNRQYEVAAALIDRQLAVIDYTGIEEFVESGQMEGESEEAGRVYRWEVVTEYEGIDNLYKVDLTVSWVDHRRVYSVSVGTMFNGRGVYLGI